MSIMNANMDRRTFVGAAAATAAVAGAATRLAIAEDSAKGTWATGTYTGVGAGYKGAQITATVTLDDTGIAAIEFADDCSQTYGIGTRALDIMPGRIIDAQSTGVDGVTCATYSSEGVRAAVVDALTQAGADLEAWAVAPEVEDLSGADPIQLEADLIVLGGGGAGMAAALSAMDQGKSVVVIEKGDFMGGNTARSEGHIFAPLSEYQKSLGIEDDMVTASNDYLYNARWMGREELLGLMIDQCGPTLDWLIAESDMPLSGTMITESYAGQSGILRAYEPTSKRASEFTVPMENAVRANSLATVLTGVAGTSLVMDGDAVTGVEAADTRTGQRYVASGAAVVVATGAFPGNNPDARAQYEVKELYRSSASPIVTGDGQLMAIAVGADTWRINQETVRVSNAYEYLPGRGVAVGGMMKMVQAGFGIVVSPIAQRIAAEYDGTNTVALGSALVKSMPGDCIYVVMDEASFREYIYAETNELTDETNCYDAWLEQNDCEAGGIAHGATVAEAAERAGLDVDQLVSTVKYYNYRLSVGAGDEFNRVDPQPLDLEGGEIYIMKFSQSYVCTSGGLWVDESMHVCDADHNPIEGLYAAGNCAGGGMGEPYYMGGSLAWSFVSGKVVGEE